MKKIRYFLILISLFISGTQLLAIYHFPFGISTNTAKSLLYTYYTNAELIETSFSDGVRSYSYIAEIASLSTGIVLFYTNNKLFAYSYTIKLPYTTKTVDIIINSLKKHYGEFDGFDMAEFEYIEMLWLKEKYILDAKLDFLKGYPDHIALYMIFSPPDEKLYQQLKKENKK